MGENSQMFQDSIIQTHNRASRMDQGGILSGAGNSILNTGFGMPQHYEDQRINLNLEEVSIHEQKLSMILEVSFYC